MPFVPAVNVAEVKLSHTYAGTPDKGWVLHYVKNPVAAWVLADLEDLNDALIGWWTANMKSLVTSQVRLDRVRSRDITTVNGLQAESTAGLPSNGTRTGTNTPPQVVLSVKKVTGFTGKSFRGRVYQFGFPTTDLSSPTTVAAAYINLVETAWNEALLLVGAVNNYDMVLVSKFENGTPRATGQIAVVQSMNVVDSRVDTNRNKLPRGSA